MINDNQAKNQTELARLFCISRASDSAKKPAFSLRKQGKYISFFVE